MAPPRPADAPYDSRFLSTGHWLTLREMTPFFLQPFMGTDAAWIQKFIWLNHRFHGLENLTIDQVETIQDLIAVASAKTPRGQATENPILKQWYFRSKTWNHERKAAAYSRAIE